MAAALAMGGGMVDAEQVGGLGWDDADEANRRNAAWIAAGLAGLHCVPCVPGSKRPVGTWRRYQDEKPNIKDILNCNGGLVTGAAGVEALDFDAAGLLLDTYLERLEDENSGLAGRLFIESSPSGGAHILYRCAEPAGNQVLADVLIKATPGNHSIKRGRHSYAIRVAEDGATWQDLGSRKSYKVKNGVCVIRCIETRGAGGYLVTAPSDGYRVMQGSLADLPMISDAERALLLDLARGLHEKIETAANVAPIPPAAPVSTPARGPAAAGNSGAAGAHAALPPAAEGMTPGEDYNERGDHAGLLQELGWVLLGTRGDNEDWGRPGGEPGKLSATWSMSKRVFYCFSSSVDLPPEQGLRLFALRAKLCHGGDYSATAATLRRLGFGAQPQSVHRAAGAAWPPGGVGESPPANDNPADDGTEEDPWDFELHHKGNAERFASVMGDRARYCHTWGCWLIWTGSHWEKDRSAQILRLMAEAVDESCQEQRDRLFKLDHSKRAIECEKWRIKNQNTPALKHSIEAACAIPALSVMADELDADQWLFNAQNGTIDLRTGLMRDHDRADLITRCSPIPYDPDGHDGRWDNFLGQVTGEDNDLIEYLQRAAGYSMTGSTREQCVFIVHGSGGTGKGTFVSALSSIIGSYSAAVSFEVFLQTQNKKTWSLANISQSRMVMCEESKAGQRLADDVFKWLTGGTDIEAEAKYGQPFTYRPHYKVWLITNNLPRTNDDDDAIWRRMQVITFDKKPKAKNKDLGDVFAHDPECQAAILAWMVAGAVEYFKRDGLHPPGAVLAAVEAYKDDQNPLIGFWSDCVIVDDGGKITRSQLRKAYKTYCDASGVRPISDHNFTSRVKNYGATEASVAFTNPETGKVGSRRGWSGIRLRVDEDDEPGSVAPRPPGLDDDGGQYEPPY